MNSPILFHDVLVDSRRDSHSDLSNILPDRFPPTPPPDSEKDISVFWSQSYSIPPTLTPVVAVIGVGYIGTHLVAAFARQYKVIAYDVSDERLKLVARDFLDLPVSFTSDAARISEASHFLIAVPTILTEDRSIDAKYLQAAINTVEKYARPGSTIIVESSVAVGMTRQLLGPLMKSRNFKVGMSPEVRLVLIIVSSLVLI